MGWKWPGEGGDQKSANRDGYKAFRDYQGSAGTAVRGFESRWGYQKHLYAIRVCGALPGS